MTKYRVYLIKDEHIAGPATLIEADGDPAAIERARQFINGCDVELWEGSRFVIGLRSSDKSGVATPDPPSNPTCPTCNVPMWLMKVQLGDVAEAQEFECKVCDGKVRRTLPRAG